MATNIPSLSNIGISALLAAQQGLTTAGENIANINTEGYSRQRAENQNRLGGGTQVVNIRRLVDETINNQLVQNTSSANAASARAELSQNIADTLADPATGLSSAVDGFFGALQELSTDPGSALHRQVLVSQGEALSRRFQLLDGRLSDARESTNVTIRAAVNEVNRLSGAIAELNGQIIVSRDGINSNNDLLDRRDQLIREVAESIEVRTVEQDDGSLNVLGPGGQALVLGTQTNELTVVTNPYDAGQLEVANSAGFSISSSITGGTLGGALQVRSRLLDPADNALGRIAAGITEAFNAQHRLGVDANGNLGGDFFSVTAPSVAPHQLNSGGTATAAIADIGGITTSNYLLTFDGGNAYTLTRESDGQTFAIDTGGASPFTTSTIDGFQLTITAGAAVGDSFKVRPAGNNAGAMALGIASGAQVASAAPVTLESSFTNLGSGNIDQVNVASVTNLPLTGAPVNGSLQVTFNATTNQLTLVPDPLGEGPLSYDPSTDASGVQFSVLGGDIEFRFSGVPSDGDSFTFNNNAGGVGNGDNRNVLELAGLTNETLLEGASVSFQGAYELLVAEAGAQTRDAEISREALNGLLNQSIQDRAAVSGVNLDEEAADLLRYQQYYQASTQLIAAVDSLFQTLIDAVRR